MDTLKFKVYYPEYSAVCKYQINDETLIMAAEGETFEELYKDINNVVRMAGIRKFKVVEPTDNNTNVYEVGT